MNSMPQQDYTGKPQKFTGDEPWADLYQALQNRKLLKAVVTAMEDNPLNTDEKCLVVMFGMIRGIMPASETGLKNDDPKTLRNLLGRETAFKISYIYRGSQLVIISRKKAIEEIAPVTWESLKVDQVVQGTVMAVIPNLGAILDIGMVEALLPIKEMGWGWVRNAQDILKINQKVDVKVIEFNQEKKRLIVSLRAVLPDPWETAGERFKEGGQYLGKICVVLENGPLVELVPGVNAKSTMKVKGADIGKEVVMLVENMDMAKRKIWGRIIHVM